eukprot:SAG25_NODE_7478_length_478_cov_1.029024_1_plen_88_part_10
MWGQSHNREDAAASGKGYITVACTSTEMEHAAAMMQSELCSYTTAIGVGMDTEWIAKENVRGARKCCTVVFLSLCLIPECCAGGTAAA